MIRFTKALVAVAVALMLPSMASALGIASITATSDGASNTRLAPGDTITFDIVIENNSAQDVFGLDLVVAGYDQVADYFGNVNGALQFVGGTATGEIFSALAGAGFNTGLENELSSVDAVHNVNLLNPPETVRVQLFGGVSGTPGSGNGQNDDGVGGGLISSGDVHFQVQFHQAITSILVIKRPIAQVVEVVNLLPIPIWFWWFRWLFT